LHQNAIEYLFHILCLGPSIKDVHSQEGGGLSSANILQTRGGSIQMRTSALFGAKNFGFFEIYGVSARARGVEPVRTFFGHGEGVNFSRFYADVFYGRPV